MNELIFYIVSIFVNGGLLFYKDLVSISDSNLYFKKNLKYETNLSSVSKKYIKNVVKDYNKETIKNMIFSIIPILNFLYAAKRYPYILDEKIEKIKDLTKKVNDQEEIIRIENLRLINKICNNDLDLPLSEPETFLTIKNLNLEKEALEYIDRNNLYNMYDKKMIKKLKNKW